MPLLMCPNDNAAMQTLERNGVQFDMCPDCRGVWLDRGELEKLMALEHADATAQAAPPQDAYAPRPREYAQPRHDEPRRYKDDDRYRHGQPGHHKKKRFDLFDIFD